MIRRSVILAVLLALTLAGPVGATIEPPPITLPPLPAPVTSLLGVAAPILATECGTLITAITLVLPMVGGDLPIDPVPLVSGVVEVCGSVPQPALRYKCGVDETVASNLGTLLGSLKILEAIINPAVAGPVAGELAVVASEVPVALLIPSIVMLADQILQCQQVANSEGAKPVPPTNSGVSPAPAAGAADTSAPETTSSGGGSAAPSVAPVASADNALAGPDTTVPSGSPSASSSAPVASQPAVAVVATGATPVGSAAVGFVLILLGAIAIAARRRRQKL